MLPLFKKNYARIIILVIFTFFLFYYSSISKSLPITFFDESIWIGKSYFFDLLIRKDMQNPLWQSAYSYDEPKLAEYSFGAMLYPLFLSQKTNTHATYFEYLSNNHLLCNTCISQEYLSQNLRISDYETFQTNIYSQDYSNTRYIIYTIRLLNIILTTTTIIVIIYIGKLLWDNILHGLLLGLLYGFNSLVITTSLVAHADALFFLFFITSLLFLQKYLKTNKYAYVFLFGLTTGVAASVKIIGFFLLIPFLVLQLFYLFRRFINNKNILKTFLLSVIICLLSLSVFITINPFLYRNTYQRLLWMGNWRIEQTKEASIDDIKIALDTPSKRAISIFNRYFTNDYSLYAAPYAVQKFNFFFKYIYLLAFIIGILSFVNKFLKKKLDMNMFYFPLIGLFMFISMLWWLMVAWDRYYLFIILPVFVIQTEGIRFAISTLKSIFNKYEID